MSFFETTSYNTTAGILLVSSPVFTSVIPVQAGKRLNVGIIVGSKVSDILSAKAYSLAISAVVGTMSADLVLQRRMREDIGADSTADYTWRDVESWSILTSQGEAASEENITALQEPEECEYRFGCKSGDYQTGEALLRIGVGGNS